VVGTEVAAVAGAAPALSVEAAAGLRAVRGSPKGESSAMQGSPGLFSASQEMTT